MVQGVIIENGCIVDVNPATGEIIDRVRVSTKAEVDKAIEGARKAQPAWNTFSLAMRTSMVKDAVKKIGVDKAGLAKMIVREMGKTLKEAEEEVDDNADKDEYCDLVMAANEPEIHGGSVIARAPHGVISICAPWNYPIEEIVLVAVPALIAGNAVVIKPSEVVPLSSGAVAKCLMEGLNSIQPGLVSLVQGDGDIGSYLVSHPGVDMCAFTGSTATGTKILQAASQSLKPVVLECGGKDPMVVFGDADLDAAAKDAVDFSLANCGQVCCAVERVYVDKSIAPAFEAKVLEHAKSYVAGNGLETASTIGPLVSEMQRQTVHRHVEAAQKAGARCILGGKLPPKSARAPSTPPTVLADVPHAAKEITQEETFGPVVALTTFDGEDETAVQLANDSTYGLTASRTRATSSARAASPRASRRARSASTTIHCRARGTSDARLWATSRERTARTRARTAGANSRCRRASSTRARQRRRSCRWRGPSKVEGGDGKVMKVAVLSAVAGAALAMVLARVVKA